MITDTSRLLPPLRGALSVLWAETRFGGQLRSGSFPMPAGSYAAKATVVAAVDGTMYAYSAVPGKIFTDFDLEGYRATENGRCLVLSNCPRSVVSNVIFRPGDDDALTLANDCSGTVVVGCSSVVADYSLDTKTLALGGNPLTSTVFYGADDGYAGTFLNCDFDGNAFCGRVWGGVWNFIGCTLRVSLLAGIEASSCKINFINCNFVTQSQPGTAPSWYAAGQSAPVRVRGYNYVTGLDDATKIGDNALYFSGCTLDGVAKYGRQLCRKASISGHDAEGTLPVSIIKTSPITE